MRNLKRLCLSSRCLLQMASTIANQSLAINNQNIQLKRVLDILTLTGPNELSGSSNNQNRNAQLKRMVDTLTHSASELVENCRPQEQQQEVQARHVIQEQQLIDRQRNTFLGQTEIHLTCITPNESSDNHNNQLKRVTDKPTFSSGQVLGENVPAKQLGQKQREGKRGEQQNNFVVGEQIHSQQSFTLNRFDQKAGDKKSKVRDILHVYQYDELYGDVMLLYNACETEHRFALKLLSVLFTPKELAETWHGGSGKNQQHLDNFRINLIRELTFCLYPCDDEVELKQWNNIRTKFYAKCRIARKRKKDAGW